MQMQTVASRWEALGPIVVLGMLHILAGCTDDRVRPVQPGTGTTTPSPSTGAPASPSKPPANSSDKPVDKPPTRPAPDDEPVVDGDVPADEKRADGEACRSDAQCESEHCSNRICCSEGECCNDADDCGADENGEAAECIKPDECQGRRGPVACRQNRCVVANGSNDDSACGSDLVADDCGLYADATCTGEPNQLAPSCANSCETDAECDAGAYCQDGECVKDRDNGEDCDTDAQCASDSCSRGQCCADGDCCETVSDCPSSYNVAAMCDEPESCQGRRGEARCVQGKCDTEYFDDDSGCGWWTPSKLCGQTRRLTCIGGTNQTAPSCGDGNCYVDTMCDNAQHCVEGRCTNDRENGESCDRDAACASNHCNNGLCCDGGQCCRQGDACADSFECVSPEECQGERYVNECMDFQCQPVETTEDDSVCWGRLINACGTFADLRCSADREQDTSERECTRWCVSSWQCDPGLECAGAFCRIPPQPPPSSGGGGD